MLSLNTRLADAAPACSLWWIRQQLGRIDMSDRAFVAYTQGLVDREGFPPPFPSHIKGKGIVRDVTAKSQFRRDAVEVWLADFLPPAGEAALDAAARAEAASDMDQAAGRLGALRLVRSAR